MCGLFSILRGPAVLMLPGLLLFQPSPPHDGVDGARAAETPLPNREEPSCPSPVLPVVSAVPDVDAGAIDGGTWETYTCVSGGFATSFPHPPQESTSTAEGGVRTDRVMCQDAQSGLQYVVYCYHLSDGLRKALPTSKDRLDRFRAVLLAKHTLIDEREIKCKQLVGRELAIDLSNGNMMLVEEFNVGDRVYLCIVGGSAKPLHDNIDDVQRFFAAFAIRPNPAGEPPQAPDAPAGRGLSIAKVDVFYDALHTIPAPDVPAAGQVLHLRVQVTGFDTGTGRIDVGLAAQLVDSEAKARLPEAIRSTLSETDEAAVRNTSALTFACKVPLSHEGRFTLRITVHDRIANEAAQRDMPLSIASP